MPSLNVRAVRLEYLGGDVVQFGGASIHINTMPRNCDSFKIVAQGGEVYYEMNDTVASTNSPGLVPQNAVVLEGPITGLTRLDAFGAQGVIAYVMFYREHLA